MTAINYARNLLTRQYVFLAKNERPDPQWLDSTWVWHLPPGSGTACESVHLIGEGVAEHCERLKHAPQQCAKCRVRLLAISKKDRL